MKGAPLIAVLVAASVLVMGCAESPATKIAKSPILVMDFVSDGGNGTTKVYIRSTSDHQFDLLSIRIDDETLADSDCILLYLNTTLQEFDLSAEVIDDGTTYRFEARVEVVPTPSRAFDIRIADEVEHIDIDELPWSHTIEEV